MRGLYVFFSILLLVADAIPGQAANLPVLPGGTVAHPYLLNVAVKCTRLVRNGNREALINTCGTCRVVSVIRKRAGISTPVRREFNLPARSQFQVPFRGPGQSRITSDIPCKSEQNNPVQGEQCVKLEERGPGNVVLVNSCGTCRGVAVQRVDKTGRPLGLQAYKLFPLAVARVAPKGAASVTISGEVACPSG